MKIITRYLFREILHHFRLFIAIFAVILLVQRIYDSMGDILGAKVAPPVGYIVLYLLYSIPETLALTFPMICLVSTIFSYGLLAKNKEILAMVASGISFFRLALPAFVFGVILTGIMFWFNESVVPASLTRAKQIMDIEIKKKKDNASTTGGDRLVKGKGNRFYYMEGYDSRTAEMLFPSILDIGSDGGSVRERIEGNRGKMVPDEHKKYWMMVAGAERWTFNPDGTLAKYEKPPQPLRVKMEEETLDLFLSRDKRPEEMNYPELRQYIALRKSMGDDVDSQLTKLQLKLAFPLSCLLMVLLGFSVVADVHARRFARGVTLGLLIAIGFYVINTFCTKMGEKGAMPPIWAAWLPLSAFFTVVATLFNRLKRIRG